MQSMDLPSTAPTEDQWRVVVPTDTVFQKERGRQRAMSNTADRTSLLDQNPVRGKGRGEKNVTSQTRRVKPVTPS